jgi:hypothetical protein
MSPDSNVNSDSANGAGEKQLCTACLFPNEPTAHFCTKCGAPISSYVAIAPFESAFAQGYVFRQAAERPGSLVVFVGIWLIFGSLALTGLALVTFSRDTGYGDFVVGTFMLLISSAIIWKTTRNYVSRKAVGRRSDV